MTGVLIYTEADGRVKFIIEEEFFRKYGLTGDYFVEGGPIPEKVFDELFDMAEEQIDSIKFDRDAFTACIDKVQDRAELVVKPVRESNVVDYLDYNEEAFYVEQYRKLLQIDDEKIFLGLMTLEEKRKELKKLRNDREYLRQYLIKNGII